MSLCGFACCHCGRCADSVADRYGITHIAGMCPACKTINGPCDVVCKACGAKIEVERTRGKKPSSSMSSPSLLKKGKAHEKR